MWFLGRLTLQGKVLLIQVGIVLLVAGLISATVVSVLARMVEQETGERALGIAPAVALSPEGGGPALGIARGVAPSLGVRAQFATPAPPARIQPLAESIRTAAGLSFVV